MDKSNYKNYKLFAVGALGTFMATFEGSIVNVALPGIATDLGCSIDLVAWVVLAYSVTLISLMLILGSWIQRTGYGFGYKLGYILFVIGSLICSLSVSIEWLIFGRIIQAIGTAMFAAVGPAMISDIFPENDRGKGIGMMVMTVSLGLMTGPPVGGLLLSFWTWPAVFLIGIPIGLIGLGMAYLFFKNEIVKKSDRPLPFLASILMSLALVALTFGLSRFGDLPISSYQIWGSGLLSLLFLIAFLFVERNPEKAMIGLDIFRNRRFVTALAAQQSHFIPFAGIMILMPFYLEQVKGMKPSEVGLFLSVIPVCMFVISPLSGKLSDRIGIRLPTVIGAMALAIGFYMLLELDAGTTSGYLVTSLLIIGIGVGMFSSPNSTAIISSVRSEQRGVTSAILGTGRNIGITIGIALSTAMFDYYVTVDADSPDYIQIFSEGFHNVIWAAFWITIAGLIVCLSRDD